MYLLSFMLVLRGNAKKVYTHIKPIIKDEKNNIAGHVYDYRNIGIIIKYSTY